MNCWEIETLLIRRELGELGHAEAASMSAHLADCASCREQADAMDGLSRDLGRLGRALERAAPRRRIELVAPARVARRMRIPVPVRASLVGAAMAVVLALAFLLPGREPSPSEAPAQRRGGVTVPRTPTLYVRGSSGGARLVVSRPADTHQPVCPAVPMTVASARSRGFFSVKSPSFIVHTAPTGARQPGRKTDVDALEAGTVDHPDVPDRRSDPAADGGGGEGP